MIRKGPGFTTTHAVPMKPPDERIFCRKAKQSAFTITTTQEGHKINPPQEFVVRDNNAMENANNSNKNKILKDVLPMKKKYPVRIKTNAIHSNMTPANIGKMASRSTRDGENIDVVNKSESSANFSDVWSVIRNINRTQFRNSPLLSDEDLTKKKMIKKRRFVNNRRDKQLTGCCTEEYAFISTIRDVEGGFSPSRHPVDTTINIIDPTELDYRYNVDSCRSNLNPVKEIRNYIKRPTLKFVTNANNIPRKISNSEEERPNRLNNIAKKYDPRALTNQKRAHRVHMVDNDVTYFESYQENSTVLYNSNPCNIPLTQTETQTINKGVENKSQNNVIRNSVNGTSDEAKKTNDAKNNFTRRINPTRPNLTQAEINRRLSKMRFPIVILAKDEINNKGKFVVNEFTQFDGLDHHIWPYMALWMGNNSTSNSNCSTVMKYDSYIDDASNMCEQIEADTKSEMESTRNNSSRNRKLIKKYRRNRHNIMREKSKFVNRKTSSTSNKRVIVKKKSNASTVNNSKLYKKTEHLVSSKYFIPHNFDNKRRIIDVSSREKCKTKSKIPVRANESKTSKPYSLSTSLKTMEHHDTELSESKLRKNVQKPKHSTIIIENVIRNVQNGTYYINDDTQKHNDIMSIATQTCDKDLNEGEELKRTSNVIKAITANDTNLKELQINTLNANQIEVNNCSQNISIVFDIVLLSNNNNMTLEAPNLLNYRPLVLEDKEINKFKYEYSIINETLPADLCTIVPKLFLDMQKYSNELKMPMMLPRVEISDLDIARSEMALLPVQNLKGNFNTKHLNWLYRNLLTTEMEEYSYLNKVLVPLPEKRVITFFVSLEIPVIKLKSIIDRFEDLNSSRNLNSFEFKDKQVCQCLQLQLYDQFNHKRTMKNLLSCLINDCIPASTEVNMITPSLPVTEQPSDQIILSIGVISPEINEIISVTFDRRNEFADTKPMILMRDESVEKSKSLTLVNNTCTLDSNKTENTNHNALKKIVLKRRHYIKLYRKCKSASNIREKSFTKIDKIRNADDFYEALGPGNLLANVVDNTMAMKIINSLKEMRTWIAEISPRQALLVMLLLNKKDTTNLIRCRPLILQAIAVNRITMSNELDMEIEVIEKEKLIPVTQRKELEKKDYLEDKSDTLLEELYFIAKTTASDYQRTFDETSENLLKSLLQKRKKLNPSYLRVMARYVGLGLLKPPKK